MCLYGIGGFYMGLSVRLEVFEGPLDLLLYLIEKNKIDIYDIPVVVITEQYLDYIKNMQTEDMNIMSEFLVMAATLLDIKCRMLLPKEVNEDGEEEDEELVYNRQDFFGTDRWMLQRAGIRNRCFPRKLPITSIPLTMRS